MTARLQFATFGNQGAWRQQVHFRNPYIAGAHDGTMGGQDKIQQIYQINAMYPEYPLPARSAIDMINPYTNHQTNRFCGNAANIEQLLSLRDGPLPFANDDLIDVWTQAQRDNKYFSKHNVLSATALLQATAPEKKARHLAIRRAKERQGLPVVVNGRSTQDIHYPQYQSQFPKFHEREHTEIQHTVQQGFRQAMHDLLFSEAGAEGGAPGGAPPDADIPRPTNNFEPPNQSGEGNERVDHLPIYAPELLQQYEAVNSDTLGSSTAGQWTEEQLQLREQIRAELTKIHSTADTSSSSDTARPSLSAPFATPYMKYALGTDTEEIGLYKADQTGIGLAETTLPVNQWTGQSQEEMAAAHYRQGDLMPTPRKRLFSTGNKRRESIEKIIEIGSAGNKRQVAIHYPPTHAHLEQPNIRTTIPATIEEQRGILRDRHGNIMGERQSTRHLTPLDAGRTAPPVTPNVVDDNNNRDDYNPDMNL